MDRKETNDRAVETGPDETGRKVWVKPRLESAGINTDTRHGSGDVLGDAGGGGAGTCAS